ncbi:MAG TPA: hypothetical protein VE978_28150 [Chitinophagales bacterium]|nr:hypothetical protein [Chitinophagales bacterium]
MSRFIKIFLLLAFTAQFADAQMKTIDIPGVRSPDDIKVDRMSNGSYVAAYSANGKTSLAFYNENFELQKKIDLQYAWGKAGHFVFTSDGDVLCIGFPKAPDESAETDFNFYVIKTNGDQLTTKIFSNVKITSLTMKGSQIFMTTYSKRENALWYHLFDTKLNAQAEKSFVLDKKSYIDDVSAAFVTSSEVLLAYSFTAVDNGTFTHNIKVAGFKTSDGTQFINMRREMENAEYSFNYIGKQVNGTYVVIGSYSFSSLFSGGVLENSGTFRLVINSAGDKQSYKAKSFKDLLPQSNDKSTELYIGVLAGTGKRLANDFVWPHGDGFKIIMHLYSNRYVVITDSALNMTDQHSLRENDNDKNEFIYEEVLCKPSAASTSAFVYMADSREGVPAVFATTLDEKHPEFKEWLKLDGENNAPQQKWTNDNNSEEKSYDLKNCNPSLVPSDASHLVLLDDANKDADGARIFVYSVK